MQKSVQNNCRKLIIFISSPGDVLEERMIADRAIRKLQKEYRSVVELVPVLWENLPLTTAYTFQEGIDRVLAQDGIDVAVFILGNRLGSSPGKNYLRNDGKVYQSGTEYEYDFIQNMFRETGKPEILVYVKLRQEKELLRKYSNLSEAGEANAQNELVKQFIKERFEDKELGAYLAYHQITENFNFETRFTEHLRGILQKILNGAPLPCYDGNPYKGLLSFEKEDENIFFGRNREVHTLESEILEYYDRYKKIPFVFICGTSGSGKSSFVKAGILPDIESTGIVSNSTSSVRIFTPQQFSGDFLSGILDNVKSMLPELSGNKYFEALYQLEDYSTQDVAIIDEAISKRSETGNYFLPVFFIDQFEEFFTDSRIHEKEKKRCRKMLAALQKTEKMMFIFSLRSDFYHYLTADEDLFQIRKNSILWDISPLSSSELREVIEGPALLAGIVWEKSPLTGEILSDKILDDAVKLQSLPLLEFALTSLYENRKDRLITFDYYQKSGGIAGAVESYANGIFKTLDDKQKTIFFKLLSLVVSVSDDGTYCRRNAVLSEYNFSEEESRVLNYMVQKRLFYTTRDSSEQAVFSIAHEFLINHWNILKNWVQQEKEFIASRKHFESAEARWKEHNMEPSYLVTGYPDLNEAEDLLLCRENHLSHSLSDYLMKSVKYAAGRGKWFYSIGLGGVNIIFLLGFLLIKDTQKYEFSAYWTFVDILLFLTFLIFCKLYTVPAFKKVYVTCTAYGLFLLSEVALCIYDFYYSSSKEISFLSYVSIPYLSIAFFSYLYKMIKYRLRKKRKLSFSPVNKLELFFQSRGVFIKMFFLFSGLGIIPILLYLVILSCLWDVSNAVCKDDYSAVQRSLLNLIEEFPYIDSSVKYNKATLYYKQNLPLKALAVVSDFRLEDDHDKLLYYNILCDFKRGGEKADLVYNNRLVHPWTKVWLALFYGNEKKAAELVAPLPIPDTDIPIPEALNYAHSLLLIKKDFDQALNIYKKHLGKINGFVWNNSLRYDFVHLKKHEKYRQIILKAEKEIGIEPIPVSFEPGINIAEELPLLQGKWRLKNSEEIGFLKSDFLCWEIDLQSEIPSYYTVYRKNEGKTKLLYRFFSHLKINKLKDSCYLLEEYYPRNDNAIASGIILSVDRKYLKLKILFNGIEKQKNKILIYERM